MSDLQSVKSVVRKFYADFDTAPIDTLTSVLNQHTGPDFFWRGVCPFYVQDSAAAAVDSFWAPLKRAFSAMQRREDIFFAGVNAADEHAGYKGSQWTCSMGHFMGLFDQDLLHIPATGRIAHLRYAEFCKVVDGKIVEMALFCDMIGLMHQAGVYPLPPMTGTYFMYPGPKTHDGVLLDQHDPADAQITNDLVHRMAMDLAELNKSDVGRCPPELLAKTWHEDMAWYGPCGIGASYTIPRYQEQHQYPFRENLTDKVFNGHVARFAEGNYAGFFGWPNLNNRNKGGFMGLPASDKHAEMRVVDVYRRDGDKLAENWVIIDLPHYLLQQGLDIFKRLKELRRI